MSDLVAGTTGQREEEGERRKREEGSRGREGKERRGRRGREKAGGRRGEGGKREKEDQGEGGRSGSLICFSPPPPLGLRSKSLGKPQTTNSKCGACWSPHQT